MLLQLSEVICEKCNMGYRHQDPMPNNLALNAAVGFFFSSNFIFDPEIETITP